jgi:hypothetical protein
MLRAMDDGPRLGAIEILCVIVVVVAFAALIAWFVTQAGGGVLNQG